MLRHTNTSRARLSLEKLEDRLVPTSWVDGNGDLNILGSNANDTVAVSYQPARWSYGIYLPARYNVIENGSSNSYLASRVWGGDVLFNGMNGNNYFRNDTSLNLWAWGGAHVDTFIGGEGADHLFGYGGDDWLYGNGGKDDLQGNWGSDHINGGYGNDWVDGGAGDGSIDYLTGGPGADGYALSWFGEHDVLIDYNYYDGDWIWYVDLK